MRASTLAVLAVLLVGFRASPAPQTAPPSIQELAFPHSRFLPGIAPYATQALSNGTPVFQHADLYTLKIAIDSRETVHAVQLLTDPSGTSRSIVYESTLVANRTANGFTQPLVLVTQPFGYITPGIDTTFGIQYVDIIVDKYDVIHVVWSQRLSKPYGLGGSSLALRVFHLTCTNGTWSTIDQITPDSPPFYGQPNPPSTLPNFPISVDYMFPANIAASGYQSAQLKLGADGEAYLVLQASVTYRYETTDQQGQPLAVDSGYQYWIFGRLSGPWQKIQGMDTQLIVYSPPDPFTGNPGPAGFAATTFPGQFFGYAVDPSGNPTFIWTNNATSLSTETTSCVSGGLTGKTPYDHPIQDLNGDGFSMVYDSKGTLYISWNGGRSAPEYNVFIPTNPMYRVGLNGPALPVPQAAYITAIHVDKQDQLHFFTQGSVMTVSSFNPYPMLTCFSRLRDPATGQLAQDFAVTGAMLTPFAVYDFNDWTLYRGWERILIGPSGRIYAATQDFYSSSMESFLGVRDSGAMAGVFPRGSVNVTSGNLYNNILLFSTSGVGPTQSLGISYNSLEPGEGFLGASWNLSSEMYLIDSSAGLNSPDDTITLALGDGRKIMFVYSPDYGALLPYLQLEFSARIERVGAGQPGSEYKMTTKTGDVFWFNTNGRLRQVVDPTGNTMDYQYDSTNYLASIRDQNGARSTTFTYEAGLPSVNARVSSITDPAGGRYDFSYQGRKLSQVSFSSGPGAPSYSFDYYTSDNPSGGGRSGMMSKFRTPRATDGGYAWNLFYHPNGRFNQVQDPPEYYLSEGPQDGVPPTIQTASQSIRYNGLLAWRIDGSVLTDRRGFRTQFAGRLDESLVTQIDDEASLAGTLGITPIVRAFNIGILFSTQDRWGVITRYGYTQGVPAYVVDNLISVARPNANGVQETVATYTYTDDGLNRVKTATTYATPPEGAAPIARTTTYDYNSAGQPIAIHHPDVTRPDSAPQTGVTTLMEWNGPRSQLSRSVNENGHSTYFSNYDGTCGLPMSILREGGTDPRHLQYDTMGNVQQTKEPASGPLSEAPGWTVYRRDGMYRVVSQTDPKGKITQYAYDLDSNALQVSPPVGAPTSTTYDLRGFVSGGSTPDGTWSQVVDAAGNVRRVQDFRGFVTNQDLDFKGRIVERRSPGASTLTDGTGGGGQPVETTQYVYDGFDVTGHFTSVTEKGTPTDRTTKTSFDGRGRPLAVLAADGLTQTITAYDEQDHVIATQQVFGNEVESCVVTFRDARDRVDHIRQQKGAFPGPSIQATHTYSLYDPAGNVLQSVDPLGHVDQPGFAHKTTTLYDVRERPQIVIDGLGNMVRANIYGDDDRLVEMRAPDPATKSSILVTQMTYAYSSRKELLQALNRDGVGTTYVYGDLPGQVTTVTDALGQVTRTDYDPVTQRVKEVTEALGSAAENHTYQTWTNGLLTETRVWNPEIQAYTASHQRFYDQAGRLEKVAAPVVAPEQYFYNSFSEVSKFAAGTKTVAKTYDQIGQLTQAKWDGAFSATNTMTYTGAGDLKSISDGNLGRQMSYESWKGTPLDEAFTVGGSIWKIQTHSVDDGGNYVGLSDPEAKLHEWPVDENNRPSQKRYDGQGVASLTYTVGGLLDQEILRNSSGAVIATTTHTYDGLGRRASSQTVNVAGEITSDYAWDYNARNEITTNHLLHLGVDFTADLDERGRVRGYSTSGNQGGVLTPPPYDNQIGSAGIGLESAPSGESPGTPKLVLPVPARITSYQYGPGGERLSKTVDGVVSTYTYNSANQLISEKSPTKQINHDYDEWGNETKRVTQETITTPTGTTTQTTTETYGYNHLNLLAAYSNSLTGALWQYDYYPDGARYGKTDLNANSGEVYVPKFGEVVTEYGRTGSASNISITPKNTYVGGLGLDSKNARIGSDGTRVHLLADQVGTVGITLDDTGRTMDTSVKDAWGVQIAGGTAEPYGGIAQCKTDSESGLVYMRNRMYDPNLGRFTQIDPLHATRASQHYSYGSNNPVQERDPSGLITASQVARLISALAKGKEECGGKSRPAFNAAFDYLRRVLSDEGKLKHYSEKVSQWAEALEKGVSKVKEVKKELENTDKARKGLFGEHPPLLGDDEKAAWVETADGFIEKVEKPLGTLKLVAKTMSAVADLASDDAMEQVKAIGDLLEAANIVTEKLGKSIPSPGKELLQVYSKATEAVVSGVANIDEKVSETNVIRVENLLTDHTWARLEEHDFFQGGGQGFWKELSEALRFGTLPERFIGK